MAEYYSKTFSSLLHNITTSKMWFFSAVVTQKEVYTTTGQLNIIYQYFIVPFCD